MKEDRVLHAPEPISQRRRRRVHVGALMWQGFLYPECFIDPSHRSARWIGRALVILSFPLLLIYLIIQGLYLRATDVNYRGRGGTFRHSSGPAAYVHVSIERLGIRLPRRVSIDLGPSKVGTFPPPMDGMFIVIDDFYEDPMTVRSMLLAAPMTRYEKGWFTSAGADDDAGTARTEIARETLARRLGVRLDPQEFASDCGGRIPGWNAAFHLKFAENWFGTDACCVHNHADLGPTTWAGVVFLSPDSPPGSGGTELLCERSSGKSIVGDKRYDARVFRYAVTERIDAVFNRLVLFPACALHRGEPGFGHDRQSGRAFQTIFFEMGHQ